MHPEPRPERRLEPRPEAHPGFSGAWDDPDRLHNEIVRTLDGCDGQVAGRVIAAAYRLRDIDPDPERGATTLALALRTSADHAAAERVLFDYLRTYGHSAAVWFQIAPLAAWRGDAGGVAAALDNALREDPEFAEALRWGFRYHERHHGPDAARAWLLRHAGTSWRARVMLGRDALARGRLGEACEHFDAACDRAPHHPGPLAAASEALAEYRHPRALVELVLRRWRGSHGPQPLISAVEAELQLGQPAEAALALTRLRGVTVPARLRAVVADLERRVVEARREAGL